MVRTTRHARITAMRYACGDAAPLRLSGVASPPMISPCGRRAGERSQMDSQSHPPAQTFNPYIGAFFAVAGIVALATGSYIVGGSFLSIGAAFLVYWRDVRPWAEIPRGKRLAFLGLILLGGVFLVATLVSTVGG
jgi:hypothetical protein